MVAALARKLGQALDMGLELGTALERPLDMVYRLDTALELGISLLNFKKIRNNY